MKYPIPFFFSLLLSASLWSQTYEVGAFLGGANAMGDVGSQQQINPSSGIKVRDMLGGGS